MLPPLHSCLHDLSKRLDDSVAKCKHVTDLFSPELTLFRVKLQDYASRLFAADPVRHGTSAMDIYWRKGLYETLVTARGVKVGGVCIVTGTKKTVLLMTVLLLLLLMTQLHCQ
jgi:hypothetical protein